VYNAPELQLTKQEEDYVFLRVVMGCSPCSSAGKLVESQVNHGNNLSSSI